MSQKTFGTIAQGTRAVLRSEVWWGVGSGWAFAYALFGANAEYVRVIMVVLGLGLFVVGFRREQARREQVADYRKTLVALGAIYKRYRKEGQ